MAKKKFSIGYENDIYIIRISSLEETYAWLGKEKDGKV
jgi:hypothetical protein